MSKSQPGNKHNEKYSADIFLELYNKGMNDSEIAKVMNCNHATITMKRKVRNLPKNFEYVSKIDKDKLLQLHKEGYTTNQLAEYFQLSTRQISSKCIEWGIDINTKQNKIQKLSIEEEQVVIGSILGDSTIRRAFKGKYAGAIITCAHSIKQEDYLLYKAEKLKRLEVHTNKRSQYDKRTHNTYYNITLNTKCHQVLNRYYDLYHKDGKKYLNSEALKDIEALGMAVWYMDDGTAATHRGYYIATNGFQWEDVQEATEVIYNKFSIKCKVVKSVTNQPMIYIGVLEGSAHKFEQLIRPYIITSMLYKLHPEGVSIPRGPYRPGKPIIVNYKGEFYKEYPNVEIAAKDIGIDRRGIDTVLKGTRKRRSYKTKDWTFSYK